MTSPSVSTSTHADQPTPGFQVGGSISAQTSIYLKRQADTDLYEALQAGDLCYVFNSRQMGKSSLLLNVKSQLQAQGYHCCFVDISRIGSVDVTLEQWYGGMIAELWRGLDLQWDSTLIQWWKNLGDIPPPQKLATFFEMLLDDPSITDNLVIFFDEVDSVLSLPFKADDFFSVIRACYNLRAEREDYKRLRFAFFGVALPSDLMTDKRRSPFNIGRAISLEGFSLQEAAPLQTMLLVDNMRPAMLLQAVIDWTGGQPFLTQKLCQLIVSNTPTEKDTDETQWVNELVNELVLKDWESSDNPEHLRTIRNRLLLDEAYSTLNLAGYAKLLNTADEQLNVAELNDYHRLYLTGVIALKQGMISPRNKLYRRVFNEDWLEEQLGNQRPYNDQLSQWLTSSSAEYLLTGNDLLAAKAWIKDKHLPESDYQFIDASQAQESAEIQAWNQQLQEEIDRRQQVEQQLHITLKQLVESKQEAETANQLKSDFLARVSHEVRTPINSVLGLSYLALQQESNHTNRDYLQKIQRSTNHMLGVVNDMLDIRLIEQGDFSLNTETFLLDDLIDRLVDIISFRIHDKGLTFRVHQPLENFPPLIGDHQRIEQLLLNIFSNAIKHTEQGDIVFTIVASSDDDPTPNHQDHDQGHEHQRQLDFIIQDNGCGIGHTPLSDEPLHRSGNVIPTGLGLNLCCGLAEKMQGSITVDSQPTQGSTFRFRVTLPCAGKPLDLHTMPRQIALVEGSDNHQLHSALSFLGHNVTQLKSLQATEQKQEQEQEHIDLDAINLDHYELLLLDQRYFDQQEQVIHLLDQYPRLTLLPIIEAGAVLPHWLTVIGIQQTLELPSSLSRIASRLDNALELAAADSGASTTSNNLFNPCRLLVVEDDEINQEIISELLKQLNLNCDVVNNGREALVALNQHPYDLVLMDIEMPILGGLEATRLIRNADETEQAPYLPTTLPGSSTTLLQRVKDIPIIAMTAHVLIDDRKKFIATGMNDHLGKPINPQELASVLRQWLPESALKVSDHIHAQPRQEAQAIMDIVISGLDTESGLHRCGGDFQVYRSLLKLFSELYGEGLKVANQDINSIAEACHGLKGSSANLGADTISQQASILETRCRNGDMPSEDELDSFSMMLQEFCQQLLAAMSASPRKAPPPHTTPASKPRILVVDDQPEILRLMAAMLKDDYHVIVATNGAKAIELANREPAPEVILLDLFMPDMDGLEVCRQLKSQNATASIPVLFVSANEEEAEFEQGIQMGAIDFVSKPVSPALLKARIKRIVKAIP